MALDSYTNLKSAVQDWMARSDLSGNVADWITLAEARLNRTLDPVETDQTLTGVSSSREISVSSYSVVEAIDLFLIDSGGDERKLVRKSDFERAATVGEPRIWDHDSYGKKIIFDCPLDTAYTFRLRFRQRFALSDSVTTNWLLDNYPDLYLAASLVWGNGFVANLPQAAAYKTLLDEGIPEVRNIIAKSKRSIATIDPALIAVARRGTYQGVEP